MIAVTVRMVMVLGCGSDRDGVEQMPSMLPACMATGPQLFLVGGCAVRTVVLKICLPQTLGYIEDSSVGSSRCSCRWLS
jgi:hypothetical protein